MSVSASPGNGILTSGLADEPALRWAAVDLVGPLGDVSQRLDLSPVAAGALGRCLTAAVLLQRMTLETANRVVLGISGDGPLSRVMAEAEDNGNVRGMVSSPQIDLPRSAQNELGVGKAIGDGLLRVWRQESGLSDDSKVEIRAGRIGDAVAHYLEQSDQTRSAVLLGVLAEREGVTAAGGMIIEALPGPEDKALADFERHLGRLPSISRVLATGGLEGLIDEVLCTAGYTIGETREVRYYCRCSEMSIRRFLKELAESERDELRTETGELEAECVFCGRTYRFDDDGRARS